MFAGLGVMALVNGMYSWMNKGASAPTQTSSAEKIQAALAHLSLTAKATENATSSLAIVGAVQQEQEKIENLSVVQQVYQMDSTAYTKGFQGIVKDLFISMQKNFENFESCEVPRKIGIQGPKNDVPINHGVLATIKAGIYNFLTNPKVRMGLPLSRVVLETSIDVCSQSKPLLLEAAKVGPSQPQCSPLDVFTLPESDPVIEGGSYLATVMGIAGVVCVVWEGCQVYSTIKDLWSQKNRSVSEQPALALEAASSDETAITCLEDLEEALTQAYESYQEAISKVPQDPSEVQQRTIELRSAWSSYESKKLLEGHKGVDNIKDNNASDGG